MEFDPKDPNSFKDGHRTETFLASTKANRSPGDRPRETQPNNTDHLVATQLMEVLREFP